MPQSRSHARWLSVLAPLVLLAGCNGEDGGGSGAPSAPPAATSPATTEAAPTSAAPTTTAATTTQASSSPTTSLAWREGCLDAPTPPQETITVEVWRELQYECFHFWAVVERITIHPYSETTYGCTADLLYGTTPPMIDEPRSIHLTHNVTEQCALLKVANVGDVVEVWASIYASDMGMGLWFQDIQVHDAG